jgi:hypothetical protein
MGTEAEKKLDELASDLDDLKTTVEELQVDPPSHVASEDLDPIADALEQATDATDELDEQAEE